MLLWVDVQNPQTNLVVCDKQKPTSQYDKQVDLKATAPTNQFPQKLMVFRPKLPNNRLELVVNKKIFSGKSEYKMIANHK